MSLLDDHRAERTSAASAFHDFLIEHPKAPAIHAFYEGDADPAFYNPHIRRFAGDRFALRPYRCGRKREVYRAREKVARSGYTHGVALFFVDRDLSDLVGDVYPECADVFVTDYYSIESYLVSQTVLRMVWDDNFHFKDVSFDVEGVLARCGEQLSRFHVSVLPIAVWAIALRRGRQRPNVQNIEARLLWRIDDNLALVSLYSSDAIAAAEKMAGAETPHGCEEEMESVATELSELDPKQYVPGKMELWFLTQFIHRMQEGFQRLAAKEGGSLRVTLQIGEHNAVEVLASRIDTPASLLAFFERTMGALLAASSGAD